jgi:long-chain acyl-CoA synthetase
MHRSILSENSELYRDNPAIIHGSTTMSYATLAEKAERLARGLAALGVEPGDRVALVHPNSPEFVLTFLGTMALGAVVVPLNPLYPSEELRYYFEHCRVSAVVTDAGHASACGSAVVGDHRTVRLIVTGDAPAGTIGFESLIEAHPAGGVLPEVSPEADAVYQYSSGSTGGPKRVPRTRAQLGAEAESVASTMRLGPDDRIFCAIPLFHTHGQGNCMLAAVRSRATLVILENPSPLLLYRDRALQVLERERVTVFPGVPFLFHLLAEASRETDLSALRLCFSAGTALPRATFDAFRERCGVDVRQLYGCTEAGALTINLDDDPAATAGSVGKPLHQVSIRVVDEARRPLPAGETGEIAVRTPALTHGYHDVGEHDRDAFRDGFFYTGDIGRLDGEGRLWITGRTKLFIQVVGNKVDPVEVEEVLVTHPAVREAVVVGAPGGVAGEEIVKAVVVAGGLMDGDELVRYCFDRLAPYKVPQLVEFRDEIPKSPLGKVLRKYLV